MASPILETVRSSALSRELQLQLQIGNCVEALLMLDAGSRESSVIAVITSTAERLRDGADDSTARSRTVGQTTSALGVLKAASLARLGDDATGTSDVLRQMAAALDAATQDASSLQNGELVAQLARLHTVLSGLTGSQPDVSEGRGRLAR